MLTEIKASLLATGNHPGLFDDASNNARPYNPPPLPPKSVRERSNDAYWATRPPEVQALRSMPDGLSRQMAADKLAEKGFHVDPRIERGGNGALGDPYPIMARRIELGYTWVNSVGQPVPPVPNVVFPGQATYDPNNPPAGSIKVSVEFARGIEF